jgi:putative transposase
MKILTQVMKRIQLGKCQRVFIENLIGLMLAIPGRINYLNLERYGERSEKSYRNSFERVVPWVSLNAELVSELQSTGKMGKRLVLAVDGSFIGKAGKHTPGVGNFWDSKVGKARRGLELHAAALIDLKYRQAFALEARQTPEATSQEESRVQHYAQHTVDVVTALPPSLQAQLLCVVVDGYYAKARFVKKLREHELQVIGKLRVDANLKYLYQGPKSKKPGRPKRFDGKVDFQDFSRWQVIERTPTATTYVATTYSVAWQCEVKVVVICYAATKHHKAHHEAFFSTDLSINPLDIIACYRARFEIEFLFRDAKQFAGLEDCQSRSPDALAFHWNASLLTVNVARVQQRLASPMNDPFVFSMEDDKRRSFNLLLAQRIIDSLPCNLTFHNCLPFIQEALLLGVKHPHAP